MKKLDDFIVKSTFFIGAVTFVSMIVVITCNVFLRLIFLKSFAWAEEISYLLLNWAVFMGVCLLFRARALVSVDVIFNVLPKVLKKYLSATLYLLLLVANVSIAYWSWMLGMSTWDGRKTAILAIPFFYYYLSVLVSMGINSGYSLVYFVKTLKNEEMNDASLEERA